MKIKNTLFFCVVLILGGNSMLNAQEASVERSVFGVQVGLFGVWAHNEMRLSNHWSLRSEIGFNTELYGTPNYFLMNPSISIAPRWYFNLYKMLKKERRIDGNSGSFLSLNLRYNPNWFILTNDDETRRTYPEIYITPNIGIRRNIGRHFNYEVGGGLGYFYRFYKGSDLTLNNLRLAPNIILRLGYRFCSRLK